MFNQLNKKSIFTADFQRTTSANKISRKILRTMLGAAVGLSMTAATLSMPAYAAFPSAAEEAVITVEVIPAGSSGSVDVPITITSDGKIGVATVEIGYDSSLLTASDCAGNPDGSFGMGLCNKDYADGVVRFNIADPEGKSGIHTLATITFDIEGELAEDVELTIEVDEFADQDANTMEVRTVTNDDPASETATPDDSTSETETPDDSENLPSGDVDSSYLFLPLILR